MRKNRFSMKENASWLSSLFKSHRPRIIDLPRTKLPKCFSRRYVLAVESEPVKSTVDELYSWAGQLASESRSPDWVTGWYVWPEAEVVSHKEAKELKGRLDDYLKGRR